MNILCHIPREDWFADRYGLEYSQNSKHNVSFIDLNCDVVWLLASWCWRQIPTELLSPKKVVCTVHHELIMGKIHYDILIDDKAVNSLKIRSESDILNFFQDKE